MTILQISILSVLFYIGALFIAVLHFGWPLAIVMILAYVGNMFDRQVVLTTSMLNLIQLQITKELDEEDDDIS